MPNDSNVKLLLVTLLAYCLGAGVFNPTFRQAAKLFSRDPVSTAASPRQPPAIAPNSSLGDSGPPWSAAAAPTEESVVFNIETLKYHCAECQWAQRCNRHCKVIPLAEAKRLGGIACKVCGGRCR